MKKENKLKLFIFIIALFAVSAFAFALYSASPASAQLIDVNAEHPEETQILGIMPSDTPESIANRSSEYLKQEWGRILLKIPVIGDVHTFFLGHPLIFNVLFNEPYSFSLTFICIFLLWIIIVDAVSGLVKEQFFPKTTLPAFGIGFVSAIILAQIGVIGWLVRSVLELIYAEDLWWVRVLLWLVIVAIFIALIYGKEALKDLIIKRREKLRKTSLEEKVEVLEAGRKGRKEAAKIIGSVD